MSGGQEQFKWNSLRDQEFKDRECYLGQSTKVGMMGKFGHCYKHDWYTKKRDSAESIESEMDVVKAYEHELMQEALGLKTKKLILSRRQLSVEDLEEFLKKEKSQGGTRVGMGSQAQKIRAEAVRKEAVEEVEEDKGNLFGEAPQRVWALRRIELRDWRSSRSRPWESPVNWRVLDPRRK